MNLENAVKTGAGSVDRDARIIARRGVLLCAVPLDSTPLGSVTAVVAIDIRGLGEVHPERTRACAALMDLCDVGKSGLARRVVAVMSVDRNNRGHAPVVLGGRLQHVLRSA